MQRSTVDLEFGVFDWIDRAGDRSAELVFDDRLAIARRADEGRFTRFHVAEHHGAPLGLAASPALFLAAAARETRRIRLVPTTFIVPLYEPLRLAEEIGMLERLAHGRLEIGIGKGSSPIEAAMFGNDAEATARRYAEHVPAILDALATGEFAVPGGERIRLFVTPSRVPTVWYPTSNPASIELAAERGQNTIFGFGFKSPPLPVIREHRDLYFAKRAATADSADPRFGILRHVFVADSDERAFELAAPAFAAHYDNFTWLWRTAGGQEPTLAPALEDLVEQHLAFVGSPSSVAAQIAEAVEATGVNYLAGAFSWGTLAVEDALDSIDRFDRDVIPAVLDALA